MKNESFYFLLRSLFKNPYQEKDIELSNLDNEVIEALKKEMNGTLNGIDATVKQISFEPVYYMQGDIYLFHFHNDDAEICTGQIGLLKTPDSVIFLGDTIICSD